MLPARLPALPTWSSRALRVFRHDNFRLYLFGLVLSQVGTWMQYTAEGLLVYRLSHSPLALGLVGFLPLIPLVPLMLVASALADRLDRRKLLVYVQLGSVFPPLALALLTWTGSVEVWHIVVIEVLMQAFAALDLPARQALVVETIEPADLDTAVAVSASGFNLARVVGPAIAGIMVAWTGEAVIFALNGISFLAVAAALFMMHLPPRLSRSREKTLRKSLVGGWVYLLREPLLMAAILLSLIPSLFILPYQRFIPVLALDVLNSGDVGVGLLNALAGAGAVVGSGILVWLLTRHPGRRGRTGLFIGLLIPFAATGFALSRTFWLAGLFALLVGAGIVAVRSVATTLVHVNVQDELRGRVTGLLVLLSVGAMRVGELGVGLVADRLGVPLALSLAAAVCLVALAALGLLVPRLRQAT